MMHEKVVEPNAYTFSILINRYCKFGELEGAKNMLKMMFSGGFMSDKLVYDSLLEAFCSKGERDEIFKLLREMAIKGFALDSKLTWPEARCTTWSRLDVNMTHDKTSWSQGTQASKSPVWEHLGSRINWQPI
ncbi:putative tetratricopeptide-like helical domain superfamily [Helianthus annuus]|nr:putative tetratricopeptide-like helical domain superfamily [Helianthus annuus]